MEEISVLQLRLVNVRIFKLVVHVHIHAPEDEDLNEEDDEEDFRNSMYLFDSMLHCAIDGWRVSWKICAIIILKEVVVVVIVIVVSTTSTVTIVAAIHINRAKDLIDLSFILTYRISQLLPRSSWEPCNHFIRNIFKCDIAVGLLRAVVPPSGGVSVVTSIHPMTVYHVGAYASGHVCANTIVLAVADELVEKLDVMCCFLKFLLLKLQWRHQRRNHREK